MKSCACVFGVILIVFISTINCSFSCLDMNGKPVDWWIILKTPKLPGNSNQAAEDGCAYSYADPNNSLYFTNKWINGSTGALISTLNQLYESDLKSSAFVMYNDESPDDKSHDSYGHTKGVVLTDSKGGYWLVHSIPRYPPNYEDGYVYPNNEMDYGQSMLCQSYSINQINQVFGQFVYTKPYVYSWSSTSSLNSTLSNLVKVLNHDFITTTVANHTAKLTSNAGTTFISFAKNAKTQELYEELVEPYYQVSMEWETWRNCGEGCPVPSFCEPQYKFDSINVEDVRLATGFEWKYTKDHSKWGVSLSKPHVTCIGDLNRQVSQNERSGGTVCFDDENVWSKFSQLATVIEDC